MHKLIGGKYQLSKLNTHYIIRMTLNFTIDGISKCDTENKQLLFALKRYIFFIYNIRSGAFFLYYNE